MLYTLGHKPEKNGRHIHGSERSNKIMVSMEITP
jgi:hypothetical protein